jgi:hypothetical protein
MAKKKMKFVMTHLNAAANVSKLFSELESMAKELEFMHIETTSHDDPHEI